MQLINFNRTLINTSIQQNYLCSISLSATCLIYKMETLSNLQSNINVSTENYDIRAATTT